MRHPILKIRVLTGRALIVRRHRKGSLRIAGQPDHIVALPGRKPCDDLTVDAIGAEPC